MEKNEELYEEYIHSVLEGKTMSSDMLKLLKQSALLEAIYDNSSVTDGPTWLRSLMDAAKLDGVSLTGVDTEKLEEIFNMQFLNASDISLISCNETIFGKLIILQNGSKSDIVSNLALKEFIQMLNSISQHVSLICIYFSFIQGPGISYLVNRTRCFSKLY